MASESCEGKFFNHFKRPRLIQNENTWQIESVKHVGFNEAVCPNVSKRCPHSDLERCIERIISENVSREAAATHKTVPILASPGVFHYKGFVLVFKDFW